MFEISFEKLLLQHKDAIHDKMRFIGLIKDYFPGMQMQINLILTAYNLGLPSEIEDATCINNAFAFRFVKILMDEHGITRANADWTVSVWCVCYGKKVLNKPCEINLGTGQVNIINEEETRNTQYKDLFMYEKSIIGNGYAVTGFNGSNKNMIIFQNSYINKPVIEIKNGVFKESDVKEVIMTDGFIRVGNNTFEGCIRLEQIVFSDSLKELGEYALSGCNSLVTANIPPTLEQIGQYAMSSTAIKNITIPKSVYYIGEGAFSYCKKLNNVDIPDNINVLVNKMFMGCEGLTKINISEKLNSIENDVFKDCINLEYIYIPDSVISIGEGVFDNVHKNFVLCCSMGSYAEEYARKHKMTYRLV